MSLSCRSFSFIGSSKKERFFSLLKLKVRYVYGRKFENIKEEKKALIPPVNILVFFPPSPFLGAQLYILSIIEVPST